MVKKTSPYQQCLAFCTADSYRLLELLPFFKRKGYETKLFRDTLYVIHPKKIGHIFIFNHGSVVTWGFKKGNEDALLDMLKPFAINSLSRIERDEFNYWYQDTTAIDIDEESHFDIITLESEDPLIKLAISYGLAQSIKLESFEDAIQQTIRDNDKLPEEMAKRGTIALSRRAILKRIGEIFIARRSINLNSEFLETPEFFWRNPSVEPFYFMTKNFLDIPGRVMALNRKLDILQELLDILNSQIQHRHSIILETVIIILISFEILISLFQFHLV